VFADPADDVGASQVFSTFSPLAPSIPRTSEELPQLVDRLWGVLGKARTPEVLDYMIEKRPELSFLRSCDRGALWAAIEARRSGAEEVGPGPTDLLGSEWEVLSDPEHAPAGDDFRVVATPPPSRFAEQMAEVVLAERLREVVAITGLTRIEAPTPGPDGAIRNRAPLSRTPPTWVPATEVRGCASARRRWRHGRPRLPAARATKRSAWPTPAGTGSGASRCHRTGPARATRSSTPWRTCSSGRSLWSAGTRRRASVSASTHGIPIRRWPGSFYTPRPPIVRAPWV